MDDQGNLVVYPDDTLHIDGFGWQALSGTENKIYDRMEVLLDAHMSGGRQHILVLILLDLDRKMNVLMKTVT